MRRGFGRPLRRMLGPDVPPLLQRANQMLSAGNYAEAASAFEQLARAAEAGVVRAHRCSICRPEGPESWQARRPTGWSTWNEVSACWR